MRLCLVPGRPEREVCEALGNIPNLSEIQNELDTCRAPSLPHVAMLENIIYIYKPISFFPALTVHQTRKTQ